MGEGSNAHLLPTPSSLIPCFSWIVDACRNEDLRGEYKSDDRIYIKSPMRWAGV